MVSGEGNEGVGGKGMGWAVGGEGGGGGESGSCRERWFFWGKRLIIITNPTPGRRLNENVGAGAKATSVDKSLAGLSSKSSHKVQNAQATRAPRSYEGGESERISTRNRPSKGARRLSVVRGLSRSVGGKRDSDHRGGKGEAALISWVDDSIFVESF